MSVGVVLCDLEKKKVCPTEMRVYSLKTQGRRRNGGSTNQASYSKRFCFFFLKESVQRGLSYNRNESIRLKNPREEEWREYKSSIIFISCHRPKFSLQNYCQASKSAAHILCWADWLRPGVFWEKQNGAAESSISNQQGRSQIPKSAMQKKMT